jgi:transposase
MVTLSQQELQRMRVIEKAVDGRLSVREAAGLLQRSERQVQRLKRRYLPNSADWVRHGNRGKPRSWALGQPLCQRVLALACGKYAGFNDSHLRQKLVENEALSLSRESVRRILRKAKRRRSRSLIFVLCPAPSTWLAVSAFVISGWSPRITPWPGQEKFFSFLRSPPAAAWLAKSLNSRTNSTAHSASTPASNSCSLSNVPWRNWLNPNRPFSLRP